mmetsp:Transcript_30591/g.57241  ORF Transcript_30591/g.57241 Transcript_30591/m.57241 type:complete len:187 (-) Transcript_30591:153-713(-)
MAWNRTNGAFIDRTSHGIIIWSERIRKERHRLGLEDGPTTADLMIGDVLARQPAPKAKHDWLPEGSQLRVFHRNRLERPRPRLGATSFEYGRFHVSHPEMCASYFRKKERLASLVEERRQREFMDMQKKHPVSMRGKKPPRKEPAILSESMSDPALSDCVKSLTWCSKDGQVDPMRRMARLERTFS